MRAKATRAGSSRAATNLAASGDSTADAGGPLSRCEKAIRYEFEDRSLLRYALTHASGASHRLASNERLEFLGDSILGMIVCEMLYHRFPGESEGELTKIKSVVVSRQACARMSRELGLAECLYLGKGMAMHAKLPTSLLAGVFESLVAAIYLDGGDVPVRRFVQEMAAPEIDAAVQRDHGDNYKSLLQQLAQRDFATTPTYLLLEEKGPDHRKFFKTCARIGDRVFSPAWGANKKEAEQRAAQNALGEIEGLAAPQAPAEQNGQQCEP